MTRSDLLTDLAGRTNKNTTLDSVTQARFLRFLNQRLRRILTIPGAQKLREATLTFASVASQADYVLPHAARVRRILPDLARVLAHRRDSGNGSPHKRN